MKRYLMSSLVRLVRPLAKIIYVNEPLGFSVRFANDNKFVHEIA